MSLGESMVRIFVFVSIIPLVGALMAYFHGKRISAAKWDAVLPAVVIAGSLFAMFGQPLSQENLNAPALSLFAIPILEILFCVMAPRFQRAYHALFWIVWLVNVAMVGFAIYLAFFFRIGGF